MINQYRTLLLNLMDQSNPNEYISPNFTSLTLPPALQQFYNLLFPVNTSRYYTQFLAYCYLQILAGANQQQFVYTSDKRVTYNINNISDYFLVSQVSNPIISNIAFPINVFGEYAINSNASKNYDDILISQLSTIFVSIYSKVNGLYYNQTTSSPNFTPDFKIQLTTNLSNITTNVINIANTGLSFSISGNLTNLSASSGLTWEFNAQAPFNFDFNAFYNSLLINITTVTNMLNYNPIANDVTSLNLWNSHFNPVYKFAGLLNCYVLQVNSLIKS